MWLGNAWELLVLEYRGIWLGKFRGWAVLILILVLELVASEIMVQPHIYLVEFETRILVRVNSVFFVNSLFK